MVGVARRLSYLAVVLALCVVLLGGWTRINDAGLSCPDWPGCYGQVMVPFAEHHQQQAQLRFPEVPLEAGKAWLEMGHRYLAGTLGLVIAALALCAYRERKTADYPVVGSYVLLLLVVVQALFGMWTVTLKLYPPVVTLHLLGGVLTLTGTLLLRLRLQRLPGLGESSVVRNEAGNWVLGVIFLLLLQMILGGWTSSNYAGNGCQDWLLCNPGGEVTPDFTTGFNPAATIGHNYQGGLLPVEARAAIQIGHRIGAGVVTAACLALLMLLYAQQRLRRALQAMLAMLVLQLLLGVLNVVHAVPVGLAMLHHVTAVLLLLTLLWVYACTAQKEVYHE